MTTATKTRWSTGIGAAAVIAGLTCGAALLAPTPAEARVFVGVGVGFPIGFPGYYYPAYPYPYYYPPPAYYSPPAYYPPPGSDQPPPPRASAGYAPPAAAQPPPITYTPRRPWTVASGRQCREYQTTRDLQGRATKVYGTACRDPEGQWQIVN
jgi:hypothetical protein